MTTNADAITLGHQTPQIHSSQYNSTMISGTSHLNELQKENRAPPPSSTILSTARSALASNNMSSAASVLSNTMSTSGNYQV